MTHQRPSAPELFRQQLSIVRADKDATLLSLRPQDGVGCMHAACTQERKGKERKLVYEPRSESLLVPLPPRPAPARSPHNVMPRCGVIAGDMVAIPDGPFAGESLTLNANGHWHFTYPDEVVGRVPWAIEHGARTKQGILVGSPLWPRACPR